MNGQVSTERSIGKTEKIVGIAVSAGLHLLLIAAVLLTHRFGSGSRHARAHKKEPLKAWVEIKAGAPDGKIKDPSKVQAGQRWGRRKRGPVRHPYGPPPVKSRPGQQTVPQTRAPGYTLNPFGRPFKKKPDDPSVSDDKDEKKKMARQAALDNLAGNELDPDDVKHGGYGTARKGRTDANAKGAYGTSSKGADDPCITQFKKARAVYQAHIYKKVSAFKRPSFISPQLAENLVTRVRVTFGTTGKIVSVATVTSSGNKRFDGAAENFIRNLRAFAPPPRCVMFDVKTATFKKTRSFLVNMKGR